MRIVFSYSRFSAELGLFGHFARRNSTWQPLAQCLLAACVEQAGHEAIILDGEANQWDTGRMAREAVALRPDIIGINAYSPFFHLSADLAAAIKKINPDQIVCGGGPHFTITKEKAMLPGFDYGFLGEAEESFPEFINAMDHRKDVRKIQGIMYRENEEIKSTGARWLTLTAMKKSDLGGEYPLDRLPLPARRLLNMRAYKLGTPKGRNYFTSIQGSRGCRWSCLVAGTKILMHDGKYANIERIKKGDRIVSADLRKGVPGIGTVIKTGNRIASDIYRLTFSDGTQIDITGDHPVWTKAGWRRIRSLSKEQQLLSLPDLFESSLPAPSPFEGNHLRLASLCQRKDSTRQAWREQSHEAFGNSREGRQDTEPTTWPSIVGFHARQESGRENVARSASRGNAGSAKDKNSSLSEITTFIEANRIQENFNGKGIRSAYGKFKTYDVEQSHAPTRGGSETECYYEEITSGGQVGPASSERDEQMREAVGQDFSPRQTPSEICGIQEVLDRAWTVGEETESRFHSYDNEIETSHPLQREILAHERKHRRTQKRLHDIGLDGSMPLGQLPTEKEQATTQGFSQRISPRWFRVVNIAFLGRGLVYSIQVAQYKNFFANNLLVHNCIFCASDAIKTKRVIFKSPKRIVEEMQDIATRFPFVEHLYFVDDVLLFYPEHILEVADRMDAEGLKFTFESSTRANTVTEPIIKRLAKSGLIRLSFGLETIDPKMRETMQKRVPIDDYPRANKICSDYGVEAMNSLMIGLPGETKETIKATINWVSEQRDIKQANLAIAVPYPGTEFHEMAAMGTHGLKLLTSDFREYLRYGHAVTNVGDLAAQDLIDFQNWGFVKIYMKYWRWGPVYAKHGIVGFLLQMWRVLRLWWKMVLGWRALKPVMGHPKET